MQKLKALSVLLFGLGSALAFAEQPNPPPVETGVSQVAVNPNVVNLNTATAAELQDKLVNIGAKKAQAIVDYRTKNGAFSSLEQLTEVSGIGKATLEKNRDRIVLQ